MNDNFNFKIFSFDILSLFNCKYEKLNHND